MATTSTIGTARNALVTAVKAEDAFTDNFHYAWPGVPAERAEVGWVGDVLAWDFEIPNIKAGRKQRQETYTFQVWIVVARPDLTDTGAKTCFDRCLVLLGAVEDALADDVQIGSTALQWTSIDGVNDVALTPYDKGWLAAFEVAVTGNARLT